MTMKLLAAGAAGLAILAGGAPASATNYTITVDASKQTAGNPRFWVAAVGTGTASLTLRSDLQTHYKIGNREIGFQRVRGHGVLSDDMGIYKGAGLVRLDEVRQVPGRDRLGRDAPDHGARTSCPRRWR